MAREARLDGRAVDEVEIAGPMLVAQCDHPLVLSDVKPHALEHLALETPVVVLQRLGMRNEQVTTVELTAPTARSSPTT